MYAVLSRNKIFRGSRFEEKAGRDENLAIDLFWPQVSYKLGCISLLMFHFIGLDK